MFRRLHPTSTAGSKDRRSSVEKSPNEIDDSKFVKCRQCGFWNDQGKISIGNSTDAVEPLIKDETVTIPGGTKTIKSVDETVQGGCRFCHSFNSDLHSKMEEGKRRPPRGFKGG